MELSARNISRLSKNKFCQILRLFSHFRDFRINISSILSAKWARLYSFKIEISVLRPAITHLFKSTFFYLFSKSLIKEALGLGFWNKGRLKNHCVIEAKKKEVKGVCRVLRSIPFDRDETTSDIPKTAYNSVNGS